MDEAVRQKVSRVPWRLAVTAAAVTAVATVCAATVGMGGMPGGVYLAVLAVAALPLLMRAAPTVFYRACLLTGMVLLGASLIGATFGLGPVVPAALLLLVASVADPDNSPGAASVALAAVLPVFFLFLFCAW
ncbi:hypothetical protein [Streptomyces sp. NBC_01233]|uniref:hypothetical protein n=1 Tax=Streptomyces sp. NBC_01233 TaxID=2903787 RepID=UPI002E148A00|nr:hypothetical protein OG332_20020 [Streptomyces sp. NBC_01233]